MSRMAADVKQIIYRSIVFCVHCALLSHVSGFLTTHISSPPSRLCVQQLEVINLTLPTLSNETKECMYCIAAICAGFYKCWWPSRPAGRHQA